MGTVLQALAPQTLYVTIRRDELRALKEERAQLQHKLAQMTQLLQQARLAPSGANLQPGHFYQLQGAVRQRLSERLSAAFAAGQQEPEDYGYFPAPMPHTLRRRQLAAAPALSGSLGVARP